MNFTGRAKRLDDIDLPRLGAQLGVGEDELHAVMDVEARTNGFDQKKRPVMLFEPHVFYRLLSDDPRLQSKAVRAGVAYKKQGTRKYPTDSYPVLETAMEIHLEKALLSASYGIGQTMGFNHHLCGYSSVTEMIEAYADDEENQLQGMVNFIRNAGLDDELRSHNWRGFARGYNGPNYAQGNYHIKLAESFQRWSKIKDTPAQMKPAQEQKGGSSGKATLAVGVVAAVATAVAAAWDWIGGLF